MEILVGLVILYVLQVVISFGLTFGHFQHRWPTLAKEAYNEDLFFSLGLSLFACLLPLVGVVVILFLSRFGKHGLKFK